MHTQRGKRRGVGRPFALINKRVIIASFLLLLINFLEYNEHMVGGRQTCQFRANLTLSRNEDRISRILLRCGDKRIYANITQYYSTVTYDLANFPTKITPRHETRLTCERTQRYSMRSRCQNVVITNTQSKIV